MNNDDLLIEKLRSLFDPPEKCASTSYLIKAYGLEEVAVFPNFSFSKGLDWQKRRGTKSSIVLALDMIGIKVDSINELNRRVMTPYLPPDSSSWCSSRKAERWNYYTVRVERIPKDLNWQSIIGLCKLSAPLRSHLYRLADASKEVKSLRLSSKNGRVGKNLLSNYSGKKVDGVWICV